MFNRITLILSFSIILLSHIILFTLNNKEHKKVVVARKSSAAVISMRKVTLKKKEVKKTIKQEVQKAVAVKKKRDKVKKIVKKAKRKVSKRIKKTKIAKKKKIKQIEKKYVHKMIPTVREKTLPNIRKKTVVSSVTKDFIRNNYLLKLRKKIETNKIYPKRAKRLKQEGQVIVSFEITKTGTIRHIQLKNASSFKRLNKAALKLLEAIARFEPIPKELGKNTWAIEVPINYSIVKI